MDENQAYRKQFEEAYEELIEPIFAFLYVRLGDRERARELAQETFMRAWTYVAHGNRITSFKPFLFTTAYNLFKNELRANKQHRSLEALMEERHYEPASNETSAEDRADARMAMEHVAKLPPAHQEVVIMHYVDGLPIKTIAEILNKPQATVSVHLFRALRKLRTLYAHNAHT